MFKRYFINAAKNMFRNNSTESPNYVKIKILTKWTKTTNILLKLLSS